MSRTHLTASPADPAAPTDPAARVPAPDLARGAALLLIAVANVHLFLFGHGVGVRGYPPHPTPVERAVALVQVLLVDGRAYPLFGALFGYGLARIAARSDGGVAVIRRRCGWLVVIGFAHAALLFSGDIVAAYGLLGLLFGARIATAPDRRLLRTAAIWLLGPALAGAVMAMPVFPGQSAWLLSMTVDDPRAAVPARVVEWLGIGLLQAFGVGAAVLVGAWAARRGLLDRPARHRSTLVRVAVLGLVAAIVGAIPLALMVTTFWDDAPLPARLVAGAVHGVSGYGGGLGYAALAALAVGPLTERRGRVGRRVGRRVGTVGGAALIACGQRSLSCYLAQSIVFVAVLAPYGGGLGDRIGLLGATAFAVATWALTVIAADALHRRGIRGPAETWLRRRTYPPSPSR